MSQPVPADDLPANLVPVNDMPGGRYIVEPNTEQRRMGLRKNRYKDENLAGNVGRGMLTFGEDIGREATAAAADYGLPPAAANAIGFAADVGTNFLPVMPAGNAAKVAAPALASAAKSSMQSAVKPTLEQLRSGKAAKAIDTMLAEGISPNAAGVAKLRGSIDDLNREILQAVQNSPAVVDKVQAARHVQDTLKKFTNQVNPESDIAAIRSAWNEFLNHPLLSGSQTMPVAKAQELKQGTYRALADKYGEQGSAATEAQKAIARGLKDEIAAAVPGVANLNKKESELLTALEVAERRALMEGNKNYGGIAWLSHSPATWAAFMADKSAAFKAAVAHMLHRGQEAIPAAAAEGATGTAMAVNASNERGQ